MSTRESYDAFLAKVSEVTGLPDLKADADGLLSLRIEETYTLNLQFSEASSKIFCFVELLDLPADTPASVFREVLVGTLFGQDTGGGWFSVEPENNTLIYNYRFDFDAETADAEAFTETLEQMLSLVDIWLGRIRTMLQEDGTPAAAAEIRP